MGQVSIAIMNTGVTSGEFGHADALETRKAIVQSWLTDENKKVAIFTKDLIDKLDASIKSGRARAQESIELRKYQYGEET